MREARYQAPEQDAEAEDGLACHTCPPWQKVLGASPVLWLLPCAAECPRQPTHLERGCLLFLFFFTGLFLALWSHLDGLLCQELYADSCGSVNPDAFAVKVLRAPGEESDPRAARAVEKVRSAEGSWGISAVSRGDKLVDMLQWDFGVNCSVARCDFWALDDVARESVEKSGFASRAFRVDGFECAFVPGFCRCESAASEWWVLESMCLQTALHGLLHAALGNTWQRPSSCACRYAHNLTLCFLLALVVVEVAAVWTVPFHLHIWLESIASSIVSIFTVTLLGNYLSVLAGHLLVCDCQDVCEEAVENRLAEGHRSMKVVSLDDEPPAGAGHDSGRPQHGLYNQLKHTKESTLCASALRGQCPCVTPSPRRMRSVQSLLAGCSQTAPRSATRGVSPPVAPPSPSRTKPGVVDGPPPSTAHYHVGQRFDSSGREVASSREWQQDWSPCLAPPVPLDGQPHFKHQQLHAGVVEGPLTL